ncbi:enhanced level of genomic instability 1 isoform 2-T3 [Cochliomyia hominivorax]
MEEVLDTVKKQHKEKHRRKKELKKLAMIEAANGNDDGSSKETETKEKKKDYSEKKHKHRDKEKRHSKKKPLQEKSTVENGKVLQESPIKSGTILQHFPRTPKKEENEHVAKPSDEVEVVVVVDVDDENESENTEKVSTPPKNPKVTNAFEVMMNARNKTIGSNTPGKESPSPVTDKELAEANAKRKLKLQEWADQKGGAKRRLEEEARAAYVEEQLEQRAKRLKQMLVSGASPKTSSAVSDSKPKLSRTKLKENSQKDKDKPKKRRGPRARRLSSVDSVDSLDLFTPTKIDPETSEFLSKLSSPTKKRDSLLGYFPKKESPKELAAKQAMVEKSRQEGEIKTDTPKSINKKESNKHSTTAIDDGIRMQDDEIGTPSGRPRRSCANKARYDYDLEESPTKAAKISKNTPVRKAPTRKVNTPSLKVPQEEDSIDIIVLDDSTNMSGCGSTTPQGTPKKLAPLFVRSLPKPSPDPEVLKARKAFLQSGVPEKLRLEQEKQKQFEQQYEETVEIFPKISHIKQLNETDKKLEKEIVKRTFKLKDDEILAKTPSPTRKSKAKTIKRLSMVGSLADCVPQDYQLKKIKPPQFNLDQISLPSLANKRAIIKNWKTEFERFPTYKCYNQMREKYRYFSAIDSAQDTEQVSESFVVTRQTRRSLEAQKKKESDNPDEEYKPPPTAPNGELLFSEKYKPLLFEQVLVNLNPVSQLKEFLSNWSNGGTGSARNSQTLDDTIDLNDSTSSQQGPACNTVVLLGPVSSGKTNAVFALANEMNFNVLEINAGMKRTGKRLIQELQEATQSHQIRKDAAGSGSSQKNLLKMSLNGLKSKLKRQNSNSNQLDIQNSDSNSSDLQQTARKCLILIEDADIVFEQTDAGFTDAIYTLAASSKRPVIIVASNPNCAHLQRLMSQNTIHFSCPNVLNISKFLAVLSLMENCPVLLDDLISLYLYNRRDLRKTLLELQFFIQSGGDRQRQLKVKKDTKIYEQQNNPNYFASPRKRQFSVEQQESDMSDNIIPTDKSNNNAKTNDKVYMHRSLFEYYTVGQNYKWRIPFPIDFHLFNVNLNEIFHVSRKLKIDTNQNKNNENSNKTNTTTATKRKSKSPKKQWLTTATASVKTPLDNLCAFYENLSVAALMDEQDNLFQYQNQNQQKPSIVDRLQPNVAETIAHCLVEKAIEVNLEAEICPYNLFDTPKNSISLCEELGNMQLRSNRARNLDYEPSLRAICRSEKIRSTLERRSTRFYHYLRNYSINVCNFSTTHYDQACEVFQVIETEDNQITTDS